AYEKPLSEALAGDAMEAFSERFTLQCAPDFLKSILAHGTRGGSDAVVHRITDGYLGAVATHGCVRSAERLLDASRVTLLVHIDTAERGDGGGVSLPYESHRIDEAAAALGQCLVVKYRTRDGKLWLREHETQA